MESQLYIQVKSSISSEMNITRYYPLRPLDPTCVANWDTVFGYNPYATQGGYSDDNGFRVRRKNFVVQPYLMVIRGVILYVSCANSCNACPRRFREKLPPLSASPQSLRGIGGHLPWR